MIQRIFFLANAKCFAVYLQASISDYCDLTPGSEKDLEVAVNQQPVAVAIEADQPAFQMYSGGVLPVKKCGKALDHGVLLVGYGHDVKLKMDYWIVKNSWGALWGESGYIRLQKMVRQLRIFCMIRAYVMSFIFCSRRRQSTALAGLLRLHHIPWCNCSMLLFLLDPFRVLYNRPPSFSFVKFLHRVVHDVGVPGILVSF